LIELLADDGVRQTSCGQTGCKGRWLYFLEKMNMAETRIIILDDDPTGSQTVHGCLLLTRWDEETLREAVLDESPLFFVLTNTRGMAAKPAADITREVCQNLKRVLDDLK
jgi:hypothetical protein